MQTAAPRVDFALLDEIEKCLIELMDASKNLDVPEPGDLSATITTMEDAVNGRVGSWHDQLAEVSEQTAELEREWTAHEQSVRKWFETIAAQKKWLESLAK